MSENHQTIEELQQRYSRLNTRKIQAETNLDNARKQLESLKSQARETFGTDDIDELRDKLKEMQSENEQKRQSYQSSLDRIESELKKVDEEYALVSESTTKSGQTESKSDGRR